jgi:hypothetical protein
VDTLCLIVGIVGVFGFFLYASREDARLSGLVLWGLLLFAGFIGYSVQQPAPPRAPWDAPHAGEATGR